MLYLFKIKVKDCAGISIVLNRWGAAAKNEALRERIAGKRQGCNPWLYHMTRFKLNAIAL